MAENVCQSERDHEALRRALARAAGLRLTAPQDLRIRRRKRGRGFVYFGPDGRRVDDADILSRIRGLAIPPAYSDVRIAVDARAHLQAVGVDEAGRVQYRYHPQWETVREIRKRNRLASLCEVLPLLRGRLERRLRRPAVDRDTVVAAVVTLIDRTHIRVGCEDYVHSGRSRGAATLLKRHVARDGDSLRLTFFGKGRKEIQCEVRSPALARMHAVLETVPGRRLFQYRTEAGVRRPVSAGDVNAFLSAATGAAVTAKDFRTLAASAFAAERLAALERGASATARRRQVAAVMREVAALLSNTPTVARKSYVHDTVVDAFEADTLRQVRHRCAPARHRSRGEAMVAALLREEERPAAAA